VQKDMLESRDIPDRLATLRGTCARRCRHVNTEVDTEARSPKPRAQPKRESTSAGAGDHETLPRHHPLRSYTRFRTQVMKEQLLKKLQDEIATLDRELKSELPKEIRRARELGDLRENAEYQAAKERQRFVQARLSMLQNRVATISMMNLDNLPKDRASFGSTVHLIEQGGGDLVYQLVMPEEADAEKGLISTSSPIGRAIVGKEEGDKVTVITPNGTRKFEITRLVTIHDAE